MTVFRTTALVLAAAAACLGASPTAEKGRSMGNPAAPLMLELYSDFACPGCKHMHEAVLPAIVLDYVKTGKAYLIFREFPNPAHTYARPAAAFAVAASRIGRYQTVSDALFRSAPVWSVDGKVWDSVASVLTPDEQKKVQAMAKDPAVLAEIQRDVDRGVHAKLQSTPTLMVTCNLRQQPWTQFANYSLLRDYLDGLLKK